VSRIFIAPKPDADFAYRPPCRPALPQTIDRGVEAGAPRVLRLRLP
jgi:hypothetical protein